MEPVNDAFKCDWIENQGISQSRSFGEIMATMLDDYFHHLSNVVPFSTVLDWGCAMGSGTEALYEGLRFRTGVPPDFRITGLDISWHAINAAQQLYPDRRWICDDHIEDRYDMIVTSNCLEHFENPFIYMGYHMNKADKFYALLVPYNDITCEDHLYPFTEKDFPETLCGFKRIAMERIPISPHWQGEQLFVLYEKVI